MKQQLRSLERDYNFQLEVYDVNAQPGIKDRYGELAPVLLWGKDIICYRELDQDMLAKTLGIESPEILPAQSEPSHAPRNTHL